MVASSISYLRMRDWEFDLYKVNQAYISNKGWCYLFFTHKLGELVFVIRRHINSVLGSVILLW